jgi:hypothetical protein
MSKNLNKFAEVVNTTSDVKILEAGQQLLSDMVLISQMKEKIAQIEEGLCGGDRAVFYFFVMGLSDDEVIHASATLKGRIRHITEMIEREKPKEAVPKEADAPQNLNSEEEEEGEG